MGGGHACFRMYAWRGASWILSAVRRENVDDPLKIYTPFPDLDRMINGFGRSELVLLAGRPFTGKTSLTIDIAIKAAVNDCISVAIFPLECMKEWIAWRILCRLSGVSSESMRNDKYTLSSAQISILHNRSKILNDVPIWIDDSRAISLNDFWVTACELKNRHSVGLLIVDHLELMNDYRNERGVVKTLKAAAEDLETTILLVSTLSGSVDIRPKNRPRLSDLANQSGVCPPEVVEPYADTVLFTHRDGCLGNFGNGKYLEPSFWPPDAEKREITEVIVAKTRHGLTGTIELKFDKEHGGFMS